MNKRMRILAIFVIVAGLILFSGCAEKQPVKEESIAAPKVVNNPDPNGRIANDQLILKGVAVREIYSKPGEMDWEDQYHVAVGIQNNAGFPVSFERVEIEFTKGKDDCSYSRIHYWAYEFNEAKILMPQDVASYETSTTKGNVERLNAAAYQELKLTVRLFHDGVQINDGYVAAIPPKKELPYGHEKADPYSLSFVPIIYGSIGC